MRNFECDATGEPCADPRCKVGHCILDDVAVPTAESCSGGAVTKVLARRSRISLEIRLEREKKKIAQQLIRLHEKQSGKRFKPDRFLNAHIRLTRDPRVLALAKRRLGIEPEEPPAQPRDT